MLIEVSEKRWAQLGTKIQELRRGVLNHMYKKELQDRILDLELLYRDLRVKHVGENVAEEVTEGLEPELEDPVEELTLLETFSLDLFQYYCQVAVNPEAVTIRDFTNPFLEVLVDAAGLLAVRTTGVFGRTNLFNRVLEVVETTPEEVTKVLEIEEAFINRMKDGQADQEDEEC